MKKLSRNEMKNVVGGKNAAADDGINCNIACVKVQASGETTSGTCSKGSVLVGQTRVETCDCSLIGGSGC